MKKYTNLYNAIKELKVATKDDSCKCNIDTYNIAINAIEKQIPKKPLNVVNEYDFVWYWNCPTCDIQHSEESCPSFCSVCGQTIDWKIK